MSTDIMDVLHDAEREIDNTGREESIRIGNAANSVRIIGEHIAKTALMDAGLWNEACTDKNGVVHRENGYCPPFAYMITLLSRNKKLVRKDETRFRLIQDFGNDGSHPGDNSLTYSDVKSLCEWLEKYVPPFLEEHPDAQFMGAVEIVNDAQKAEKLPVGAESQSVEAAADPQPGEAHPPGHDRPADSEAAPKAQPKTAPKAAPIRKLEPQKAGKKAGSAPKIHSPETKKFRVALIANYVMTALLLLASITPLGKQSYGFLVAGILEYLVSFVLFYIVLSDTYTESAIIGKAVPLWLFEFFTCFLISLKPLEHPYGKLVTIILITLWTLGYAYPIVLSTTVFKLLLLETEADTGKLKRAMLYIMPVFLFIVIVLSCGIILYHNIKTGSYVF